MNKIPEKKKLAAVCYCLFAGQNSSKNMTELLCWCQEVFEKAGYQEVYQSFVMGRKIPFVIPFQKYPIGFRCEVDETEAGKTLLENLVLSYEAFTNFVEKVGKDTDCYLLLLVTDKVIDDEDDLLPIINRYNELKNKWNLQVCSIYANDRSDEGYKSNFIDAYGENGIKSLLSK